MISGILGGDTPILKATPDYVIDKALHNPKNDVCEPPQPLPTPEDQRSPLPDDNRSWGPGVY